jgi:hypothetical protein
MLRGPAIRPTVTQRVRRFLASQGAELRPWSGLQQTYDELYALLRRRRDDPSFWSPLTELLQAVVDAAANPHRSGGLALPQAELLASWDVQALVRQLREALPAADLAEPGIELASGRAGLSHFTSRLSASVLGGFLLLGVAATGCDPAETADVVDAGQDAGTAAAAAAGGADSGLEGGSGGGEGGAGAVGVGGAAGASNAPWHEDCPLDSSSILWTTIAESNLSTLDKQALCECFATLNTSWHDGLTELFETGTAQEIASALESMLQSCCQAAPWMGDNPNEAQYTAYALEQGCPTAVPVYKGVAFPA